MNKGIRRATGDVVGILCADDRYSDPFVIRDVLRAFGDAAVEARYGDLTYVSSPAAALRAVMRATISSASRGGAYRNDRRRMGRPTTRRRIPGR